MTVHLLEPVAPSLHVPRAHPCAAWMDQDARQCGATPTWLHRRICAHQHTRDLWLCHTHEVTVRRAGAGSCRECAALGHWCPAALITAPDALSLIRAGL